MNRTPETPAGYWTCLLYTPAQTAEYIISGRVGAPGGAALLAATACIAAELLLMRSRWGNDTTTGADQPFEHFGQKPILCSQPSGMQPPACPASRERSHSTDAEQQAALKARGNLPGIAVIMDGNGR